MKLWSNGLSDDSERPDSSGHEPGAVKDAGRNRGGDRECGDSDDCGPQLVSLTIAILSSRHWGPCGPPVDSDSYCGNLQGTCEVVAAHRQTGLVMAELPVLCLGGEGSASFASGPKPSAQAELIGLRNVPNRRGKKCRRVPGRAIRRSVVGTVFMRNPRERAMRQWPGPRFPRNSGGNVRALSRVSLSGFGSGPPRSKAMLGASPAESAS